jgi:hypothetical protein
VKLTPESPHSIINFTYELDRSVYLAQRMEELRQLAEYRKQKIETIKEWSKDPEAARQKILAKTKETGEGIVKDLERRLAIDPNYGKFEPSLWKDHIVLSKPKPKEPSWPVTKPTMWQRIKSWFRWPTIS